MENFYEGFLRKLLAQHEMWRNECINLVSSENALSPTARKALQNDMGQRYFFNDPYSSKNGISYSYRGTKFISEVIKTGEELAKEIFRVDFASLYPLSGHNANMATLIAFCQNNDTLLCHNPLYGGYPGLDRNKLPMYLGLKVEYFPMKQDIPEKIDIEVTKDLINEKQPKIIVFSSAHTLFPIPMNELVTVCKENSCVIVYDASHPLGLIAGNQFQDPLREGADILIGSTQKTFPGPQGGIILANKYIRKLQEVGHFVIVDNPHFHRIAALTVTLSEIKYFGEVYAKQIVKNAKSLAKNLDKQGIPVRYRKLGYTESHMLKLAVTKDLYKFTENLEDANIIMDNSGRIGCSEVTRYGMKEGEMKIIAEFIGELFHGEKPSKIKKEVIEFRKSFQEVEYCFKNPYPK